MKFNIKVVIKYGKRALQQQIARLSEEDINLGGKAYSYTHER